MAEGIKVLFPLAAAALAVAPKIARSWSYDPELLVDSSGLADLQSGLLMFSENVRNTATERAPETVRAKAELMADIAETERYRDRLTSAEIGYKATSTGGAEWKQIKGIVQGIFDKVRKEAGWAGANEHMQKTKNLWYAKVCRYGDIEPKPELFPELT